MKNPLLNKVRNDESKEIAGLVAKEIREWDKKRLNRYFDEEEVDKNLKYVSVHMGKQAKMLRKLKVNMKFLNTEMKIKFSLDKTTVDEIGQASKNMQ